MLLAVFDELAFVVGVFDCQLFEQIVLCDYLLFDKTLAETVSSVDADSSDESLKGISQHETVVGGAPNGFLHQRFDTHIRSNMVER